MGRLASPLEIRAHHLLCLLGFHGMGYNEEFIANLKMVALATIFSNSSLKIIDHCDAICAACPHRNEDECHKSEDSAQQVQRQDSEVADKLGVQTCSELTWQGVRELIRQKIRPDDLVKICRDCEWLKFRYCVDAIEEIRPKERRASE